MNIIVLIKQVIDVELNLRIKDGALVEDGLNYVISSWDETAIEAALQLVETVGAGEVTLITIGPERASDALRKGLAMGADKAVHVLDSAFDGSDSFAYARGLAKLLETREYDLILAGKQAQDTDAGLTPSMLAEFLGLPQVTNIVKVDQAEEGKMVLHRKGDHGNEVIELTLPAVVSVNDSLNEPRLASLRGIMQAKKKPMETMDLAAIGGDASLVGESGRQTKIISLLEPEARQAGKKFEGSEEETSKQVIDLLLNEAKIFA
ncbi:MAG: electron transfer flavoprotein subunit beta/FixA family protein [SAR324 cluster bacterium]|nr:electron transfer flavoprotein subunit beta/FixA family protein [SAR324 cluster bacterium]